MQNPSQIGRGYKAGLLHLVVRIPRINRECVTAVGKGLAGDGASGELVGKMVLNFSRAFPYFPTMPHFYPEFTVIPIWGAAVDRGFSDFRPIWFHFVPSPFFSVRAGWVRAALSRHPGQYPGQIQGSLDRHPEPLIEHMSLLYGSTTRLGKRQCHLDEFRSRWFGQGSANEFETFTLTPTLSLKGEGE